jgi:hypothetical protein
MYNKYSRLTEIHRQQQTTDQATLHCPTLQIATPAQMNARRWASMASMVPFIRIEENIA